MENVFIDTDIILDLLASREPFYIHAAELFSLADKNELKLFVSSLAFANLNYILSKQFSAAQAYEEMLQYYTQCKAVNGTLITIWHNNFLGMDNEFRGWREIYEKSISVVNSES